VSVHCFPPEKALRAKKADQHWVADGSPRRSLLRGLIDKDEAFSELNAHKEGD